MSHGFESTAPEMTARRPRTSPDAGGPEVARPVPIARRPLREDVRDALVRLLTQGELTPGTRIKEADLAARLGVSRTPLREALQALEREGFLESRPSRGFHVLPLTVEEVRETYPIIWSLERLALDLADPRSIDVRRLRALNRALAGASDPEEKRRIDGELHAALVAAAGNQRLSRLLDRLKGVARRYEAAHLRDDRLMRVSRQQHEAIIRACARGEGRKAADLVEEHWRVGMESIVTWLQAGA